MGRRKAPRFETFLPYTELYAKARAKAKLTNNIDYITLDTEFYRGIRLEANDAYFEQIKPVVYYSKFNFQSRTQDQFIWEHLTDNVVFASAANVNNYAWYLVYNYEMRTFDINISDARLAEYVTDIEWLAKNSKFIPVLVYYPSMIVDKRAFGVSLPYRVWLNSDFIDDDTRNKIDSKMRSNMATIDDNLTITFVDNKPDYFFDAVDCNYIVEGILIDGIYERYEEFKLHEYNEDPRFRVFYGTDHNDDSDIKRTYKRRVYFRDKVFTDKNETELRVLLTLTGYKDFTYRYIRCLRQLYYWSEDIYFEDNHIVFKRNCPTIYGRDQIFTIELYKTHYKILDPTCIAYKNYMFELDLPQLTWYLYVADSLLREMYILDLKKGVISNMTTKKEELQDVEKEEKKEINNYMPLMSEVDQQAKRKKIISDGFLRYYVDLLEKIPTAESQTVSTELRKLMASYDENAELVSIDGLHGVVSTVRKALANATKESQAVYVTDVVDRFLVWSLKNYNVVLFKDFILYRGVSGSKETLQAVMNSAETLSKRLYLNQTNLKGLIADEFKETFKYTGVIVYPDGEAHSVYDLEINYSRLIAGTDIDDLLIVPHIKNKNMVYFVAGSNIIEEMPYGESLLLGVREDLDSCMKVRIMEEADLIEFPVACVYEEFMDKAFNYYADQINSKFVF